MSVIVIGSIVVTGLLLVVAVRLVRHQRNDAKMHRFVMTKVMTPKLDD